MARIGGTTTGSATPPAAATSPLVAYLPGYAPCVEGVDNLSTGPTVVSGQATITGRSRHVAVADAFDLRFRWGAYYQSETTAFPNGFTVKAAYEVPGGAIHPIYFNGQRTVTLTPGQTIVSDPLPVAIAKGDVTWVRTNTSVATNTTDAYPLGRPMDTPNGEGRVLGFDYADTGTVTGGTTLINPPTAILGKLRTPGRPIVGGFGASTLFGTGDNAASVGQGYMRKAMAGNYPLQWVSQPGDVAVLLTPATLRGRGPLLQGCTHIVCGYGAGDYTGGNSAAAIQSALLRWWRWLSFHGAKVYQTTVQPKTTSTDAWATTGGQTIDNATNEAARKTLNAWIRAGAPVDAGGVATTPGNGTASPYLNGFIEVTDIIETARDSGIWKAGLTADGLHPNAAGHTAIAATINPALLFT
jgi:lysophospholipase L1-like esterase